ncbi:predicted protein [Uncinocarpus reesii 1704]|uniref:Phosphatidate phosphatase APP1 catalytic domain-containing protein n=1 Tax=Uncinocarpus reesii (strain UAMH 1704) TaxID=336963 RepID=C4JPV7_UNCRE|nr:uncharacterized protein UREG_04600 [Uncinocarpus reesii 1704]EEP79754.1 predicted protein [Uncinocarpus reesii 1704]
MESRGDSYGWGMDGTDDGYQRGSRRKKVFDYLKAANDLRQAYSAQWMQRAQDMQGSSREVPNGLTDIELSRSGNEEMVLFPSYGRKHVKVDDANDKKSDQDWPNPLSDENADKPQPQGTEYWESFWHKFETEDAIVDVDVRGWIYSPQKDPMSRKNRLLVALARKISGIPSPDPADPSLTGQEDASVDNQAESIARRQSGNNKQSLLLTQDEISTANAQLMERLRPFLTNPAVGMPVTVFFFNDIKSQSRTILTNDGGHFAVRASLDFAPSHIRVLASENLSATEEIKITEPNGVSLISDIDDTIKHSAIISGAKEMFRNTFVRNLADLSVLGVKEWYSKLASMGVGIHYVSNSPWQLYPLLKNYFALAGLPPGSMHLKQYSGMFQGIFEPTSERKRPTLERIIQDFPDRQFILVGDSGEADLEIYTELVLANPGRILAIFIRDVTTPATNGFFDRSISHFENPLPRSSSWNTFQELSNEVGKRPPLPPRKPEEATTSDSGLVDLIDLESDNEAADNLTSVTRKLSNNRPIPPVPPSKPTKLRGGSIEAKDNPEPDSLSMLRRKPVPPPPAKPRALSGNRSPSERPLGTSSLENVSVPYSAPSPRPRAAQPPPVPPPRRSGTNTSAKSHSASFQSHAQASRTATSISDRSSNHPMSSSPSLIIPTPRTSTPQPFSSSDTPIPNKREEAWRRRWLRAREILDRRGVALHSWRVGGDVQEVCVGLVKQAQGNIKK